MNLSSPLSESQNLISEEKTSQNKVRNRSAFSLALLPLALLGVTCGFSLVQRTAAAMTHSKKESVKFGNMTEDEAKRAASLLCSQLTSSPTTAADVSQQCAYSWRRQTMVREWNVLCDSNQGRYLVRINADTRRIYAINRMDTVSGDISKGEAATMPQTLTEPIIMTRTLAEERARAYLKIVGVPLNGLKQLESIDLQYEPSNSEDAVAQWNFTYRRSVPGFGKRLLKVSVNGATGGLEHVWNPVYAM
ncbi:MAG: hypothetical protein V4671_26690 [Armatimonadota bacterium]